MRRLAIELNIAGYGAINFWMSQPLIELPGWLELANDIAKRRAREFEKLKKKHR